MTGTATVTITSGDGTISRGDVQIVAVAPGLFTANSDGQGAPAANVIRVKPDNSVTYEESAARFDQSQQRFVPRPIDLGPEGDQVFLSLYGTGIRFNSSLSAVMARIGGADAQVLYAGAAPGLVGADQINVRVPRSLVGRGEVDLVLILDGKTANTVKVAIR